MYSLSDIRNRNHEFKKIRVTYKQLYHLRDIFNDTFYLNYQLNENMQTFFYTEWKNEKKREYINVVLRRLYMQKPV